ncbi:hypothetical protein RM531_05460 [Salinisphaera sp. P385]|uniref:Uncharacterized protein n=1 Tax=Spectribacter acetivorans TaxID=3075603 RepID=A0ABU3BAA1_9GAMM|nr:hypothetical protein [Salinisphaera sp. P385]MDT0617911.1 hypothetical protein [Salinisphaera sp. P385]
MDWRLTLTSLALALAPGLSGAAGEPEDPRDFIEFGHKYASDCTRHRAEMRLVENTHETRTIEVVLWRYLGDTRSQGRSVKQLAPGADPEPLGCTAANGLERRWEIERIEFVP